MTRPHGAHEADAGAFVEESTARKWTWPRRIGRFRSSTVVLIVAFLGTAILRGYFMSGEPEPGQQEAVLVPLTTTQEPQSPVTTTPPPTTTTPPPSTTTGPAGASDTNGTSLSPTTSPLIVLPPGLVPSGVELPPGVAVETTAPATPTASPPTTASTP
ncbi:hypothetical protein [Rhodococcus triatomae]